MVEFKIKVNSEQRLAYIPKRIVEALGYRLKATSSAAAVLFYPESADLEDVVRSLDLIRAELLHSSELKQKKVVCNEPN